MKRHVLIFGLVGGLYGALIAILFATFGIWLGLRITRSRETSSRQVMRETVVVREVLVPAEAPPERSGAESKDLLVGSGSLEEHVVPFSPNAAHQQTLGITARELEILTLVARGLSNREIATQLFVSENTVKTHCSRAFDKLGAARRTQAVQRGKELGLLP